MSELNKTPYRPLGRQLKSLRTRINESLAEASGAVEIDVRELASYELGAKRPTEEVLLLLISHFGAKDDEAVSLWEMAGYNADRVIAAHETNNTPASQQGSSSPVIFTDIVDVTVNNFGVVMNFMQTNKNGSQSVSKVGMSREHAKSVLKVLDETLSQFDNLQKSEN